MVGHEIGQVRLTVAEHSNGETLREVVKGEWADGVGPHR